MTHIHLVLGGAAMGIAFAACTSVTITRDTSAAAHGSTGSSTASTAGSGASGPGGTTGSGGGTSSSGTGGGSAPAKVTTAETDIGQYVSVTVQPMSVNGNAIPVVALTGPFFVSDVFSANSSGHFTTVLGNDCSTSPINVLEALNSNSSNGQSHGLRLPILAGQTLCVLGGNPVTVLGWKPY